MKNLSIILSTIATVIAASSLIISLKTPASTPAPKNAGKAAVFTQDDLKKMLTESPQIVVDAMNAFQAKQQEEEEKAANAALADHVDEINSTANAPFVGDANAAITVVEFFDFSCGYCVRLAPHLEKVVADNSDVKFVFKPLTFLGEMSVYKAKAALAADRQGKFLEFYSKAMEGDYGDPEAVNAMAQEIGLDLETLQKDMESPEIQKNLDEISNLAQTVRVNGVPTLIMNGRRLSAYDAAAIQNEIDGAK